MNTENKNSSQKNSEECFNHSVSQKLERKLFSGEITFEEFCNAIDQQ